MNSNNKILMCVMFFVIGFLNAQNIAVGKPTSQSSIYDSEVSSKAVDGNTDGNLTNGSVTHTNSETNPWFKIDLENEYDITQINIYNRTDYGDYRLIGAKVMVGSTDSTNPNDYSDLATLNSNPTQIINNLTITGSYVLVSLEGSDKILSLAEVEVYGVLSSIGGSNGSSLWTQSGSNITYADGNVGIGTTIPDKKLVVNGDIKWGNAGAMLSINQGAAIELRGTGIPFIDFSNDPTVDYDVRLILTEDDELFIDGGNVGIGTQITGEYKLAVGGKIRAEEIKVDTGWADYVFKENYKLPTLKEVAKHIKENGHLINIPSAKEVKANGIELGEMNKLLLEKIEELTLYILEQEKRITVLEKLKN